MLCARAQDFHPEELGKVTIPRWVLLGVAPTFLATNCVLAVVGIVSGQFEYFWLSFVIGTPFLVGLVIAAATRSRVIIIFALASLVSGWLAPLGFFLQRDTYQYSGFSAVKDFDFSAVRFIGYYVPVIVAYYVILLVAATPMLLNPARYRIIEAGSDAFGRLASFMSPQGSLRNRGLKRLLFLGLVAVFASTNWWMYNNGIGLTGITPPELPFHLSGILYYTARFVFPVILTYLFTRFRPSIADLYLVIAYACFASLTSVSRTVLVLLFLPIFVIGFVEKRYLFSAIAGIIVGVMYPVIEFARNVVYLIQDGVSTRNVAFSLPAVILNSASEYRFGGFLAGPLALVARVGGGQDVALAAQYFNELEGPVRAFLRLYVFDFWDMAHEAQARMFAWAPDTLGWATGDGGFFAHLLLVSSGSWVALILVAVYAGLMLALANVTYIRFVRMGVPSALVLLYAILFCVFFFALSIPAWTNMYLGAAVVASRSRALERVFGSIVPRPTARLAPLGP
jgi:hypothetical protein